MLDATKYMNRLRVIVKSVEEMGNKKSYNLPQHRLDFITNRVNDIIKDYDKDFDEAMEKMEIEEMLNMKRGDPYAEGTG
jgi:hypothetical protein